MTNLDQLDIVIRHADGKVIAGIPKIALYATAGSVTAALDDLERKKNILKDDIAVAGIADPLPEAFGAGAGSSTDSIARFAIKSAIVAVMILLVLGVSGAMLVNRIESAARGITGTDVRGGRQFWTGVEQSLEKMADPSNDLPEEQKQKLLANLRVVVTRFRPFVAEIAPLFAPATPAPTGR